jgi:hypothetical protein
VVLTRVLVFVEEGSLVVTRPLTKGAGCGEVGWNVLKIDTHCGGIGENHA